MVGAGKEHAMKCAVHPEVDATGYCRNCGKALCTTCSREVRGMIYCEACLADMVTQPRAVAGQGGRSPALATMLGFVPGLGAVYNGEYTKALVHVCTFIAIIAILVASNSDVVHTIFGLGLAAFIIYMAVDANRTAKANLLIPVRPDADPLTVKGKAIGPFILIGIGVIFLLQNFHAFELDNIIDRWWPLLLIAVGGFMVWRRSEKQS
jgi:hypothetical protein